MSQPMAGKMGDWSAPRRPFIGRRRECEAISRELAEGTKLLTIVGPSGMGKTRLALELAAMLQEDGAPYADEIRFCSLLGCETAADVEAAVAEVMGLPDQPGALLSREGASASPMLLILDNVDQLGDEAAAVAANLFDYLEGLQILVTSIAPLGVEWEVCFELGPLEPEDALALYRDRIQGLEGPLAPEEDSAVEALVGRLDRIPLAIELAAARVQELPPRLLLERMSARFSHLRVGDVGRHSSLEAAISLSWALLRDEEKDLLARASVFVGGFTLEAIGAVLGRPWGSENEVDFELVALLEGVMAKALLQRDGSSTPRFSSYESLRDFAAKALRESGKEEEALARHAAFFQAQARRHSALREGGEHATSSVAWLRAERENLLAAHRRTAASDPLAAAELGLGVLGVQEMQGASASELSLYDSVVDAARRSGEAAPLMRALIFHGAALLRHGEIEACRGVLNEALQLSQAVGAKREESQIRANLGVLLARRAELKEAKRQLELGLAIALELGDLLLEAVNGIGLSLVASLQDEFEEVRSWNERVARIAKRSGSQSLEARALSNLGIGAALFGEFREGRQYLRQALEITRERGDRGNEANVLIFLGGFEVQAGDLDEAERRLVEAFKREETHGNRRYEANGTANLGMIALERGSLRQAEQRLSQALGLSEEAGDRNERAICQLYLAAASALRGKLEEARRLRDEARSFFKGLENTQTLRAVGLVDGFIALQEARRCASAQRWEEAAELEAKVRALVDDDASRQNPMARPTRLLLRVLEGALEQPLLHQDEGAAEELVVGEGARWLEFGGERRVQLETRESLRKMLWALVQHRLRAPGSSLSSEELFEAGWNERIKPDSAGRRVYTGIWTLRTFGLSTAILHDGEGYLLDPSLAVVVADAQ